MLLIVTAAFMLLARANHFVVFFLALETAAVGLYVLVGNLRRSAASLEAGVKYLVAGGLSSALLLMGIVLIYGSLATPTNDSLGFADIAAALQAAQGNVNPLTLVGVALVFAGAAFKLGAFPFHAWIPDVYQGAPTPTTAFLGTASKAAGALALFVLVTGPFAALGAKLGPLLAGLAILTLLAGNLAALAATDVKRTLALSGVAHAGFLLAALAVAVVAPNVHFETIGGALSRRRSKTSIRNALLRNRSDQLCTAQRSTDGGQAAATAIMTTDTVAKQVVIDGADRLRDGGKAEVIKAPVGAASGAGGGRGRRRRRLLRGGGGGSGGLTPGGGGGLRRALGTVL